MTQPIRILYVGPTSTGVFDPSSLEQQSRAVRLAGGTVTRYEGHSNAELAQAVRDADAVMVQGHGFDQTAFAHMGLHGRCKGLVSFGHGFDHLDLDAATTNGVILANTASFGTEEVSNHTMMHFLVCSRKYVLHDKLVRSGVWTRKNLGPMGHIAGQVFGIVGLGDIGRAADKGRHASDMN
jgi:D-3-phosphoglycerate dehydrogenase